MVPVFFLAPKTGTGLSCTILQNTGKFFVENFHRDEPFHLNSPRNFLVYHTNGKRSISYASKTYFHNKGFAFSLVSKVRIFGTRKWPQLRQYFNCQY